MGKTEPVSGSHVKVGEDSMKLSSGVMVHVCVHIHTIHDKKKIRLVMNFYTNEFFI